MILEITQLLWATLQIRSPHITSDPNFIYSCQQRNIKMYKLTHRNHPMAIWTRKSYANFVYARTLGLELCGEYSRWQNKTHACEKHLNFFAQFHNELFFIEDQIEQYKPDTILASLESSPVGCTAVPLCITNRECITADHDLVNSYRNFYCMSKSRFAKWSRYGQGVHPSWYQPMTKI